MDSEFDACTVGWVGVKLPMGGNAAGILSPLVLSDPWISYPQDRKPYHSAPRAVRGKSRLIYRHHHPRLTHPGLFYCQGGGGRVAIFRVARQTAAHGLSGPQNMQRC